jgi:C4-dicarboxylate-specific signal transduction histidine kinase
VDRVKRIIDHIRSFSRSQKIVSFDNVDINTVINNSLLMVGTQFKDHGITLSVSLKENMPMIVDDKYKLEQVVLNLLSNARHAVDEKEEQSNLFDYQKQIEVTTYDDEVNVYISIKDNGTGISQQNIDKIYDPFFTTKKEGQGTGLGLPIAYGFIKDILGDIKVDSVMGEYTNFTLVIPKS